MRQVWHINYIKFPRINDSFISHSKFPHELKPLTIWNIIFITEKNSKVFMTNFPKLYFHVEGACLILYFHFPKINDSVNFGYKFPH